MFATAEHLLLAGLMMAWVMLLPPGSLYAQSLFRLILVLLWIGVVALVAEAPLFFYSTGRSATLGVLAGILIRLTVYRRHPDRLFCVAMIPLVAASEKYFSAVISYFCSDKSGVADNASLEKIWGELPRWVNTAGFDRRLQLGYQFFMQRLSDVSDVLFSLRALLRRAVSAPSPAELRAGFSDCAESIKHLFAMILSALHAEGHKAKALDFSDKLFLLETAIRKYHPPTGNIDDARQEKLLFADAACCLEDLRWLLLKLTEVLTDKSLPAGQPRLPFLPVEENQIPIQPMPHHKGNDPDKRDNLE